jgi:hypothetical protein
MTYFSTLVSKGATPEQTSQPVPVQMHAGDVQMHPRKQSRSDAARLGHARAKAAGKHVGRPAGEIPHRTTLQRRARAQDFLGQL